MRKKIVFFFINILHFFHIRSSPNVPFHYCCCNKFASSFDVAEFDDENALVDADDELFDGDDDVEPSELPSMSFRDEFSFA